MKDIFVSTYKFVCESSQSFLDILLSNALVPFQIRKTFTFGAILMIERQIAIMANKRGVRRFILLQSRLVGHVRSLVHQLGLMGDIGPTIVLDIGVQTRFLTQIVRVRVVFSARKLVLILLMVGYVLLVTAVIHGDRSRVLGVCACVVRILLIVCYLVKIYSDDVITVRWFVN